MRLHFILAFTLVLNQSHGAFLTSPLTSRENFTPVHHNIIRVSYVLKAEDSANGSSKSESEGITKVASITKDPEIKSSKSPQGVITTDDDMSIFEGIQGTLETSFRIAQESRAQGYDFRQLLANVLAGEYDAEAIGKQIDQEIQQSPCVMFTWERSPSCVRRHRHLRKWAF
jgi:hypothetical protein